MKIAAVVILAITLTTGCATTPPPYQESWGTYVEAYGTFCMQGMRVSPEEAGKLEAQLKSSPTDIDTRALLIGYYQRGVFNDPPRAANHIRHLIWAAENQPWSPLLATTCANAHRPNYEPAQWIALSETWARAVKRYGNDPRVLVNAAEFFNSEDLKRALELHERAVKFAPDESSLHNGYANALRDSARRANDPEKTALFRKALKEFEETYRLEYPDLFRPFIKFDIAETAFDLRDLAKARERANELLTGESTQYHGERAHILLARIDTATGDKVSAMSHIRTALSVAAKTDQKYGNPNLDLVKEMIDKQDQAGAIEYLKLCEGLYKNDVWKLKSIQACIRAGKTPEFSDWYCDMGSTPCTSTVMSTP